MSLTREDLENGLMRRLWHASGQVSRVLSDQELDASVEEALEQLGGADPWVFGYGSLVWNPLLHYVDREAALLRGYHRRFCLWSRTGRGSPEHPGLVLGLDRGGCCRGIAYRIDRTIMREELRLLWRREMLAAAYSAKWFTVQIDGTRARALAFVVNRTHPNYSGKLSIDDTVRVLATAVGGLGSAKDYLLQTCDSLAEQGVSDPHLQHLRARVLGHATEAIPDPAEVCL